MFNYYEIPADKRYASYLNKFWVIDHSLSALPGGDKYALPNGCVTLVFITGNGALLQNAQGTTTVKSGIYLFGQLSTRMQVAVQPYTKVIGAQLTPWAACFITNLPMDELTDSLVDISLVNKPLFRHFNNVNIADDAALVPAFYKVLDDYPGAANSVNLVKNVINTLTKGLADEPLKIRDIATDTGFSKRYVEKKFLLHTGFSPKQLYTVLRVRHLVDVLKEQPENLSLTRLALDGGFYDQSHFIKAYTGIMQSQPGKFDADNYILPLGD